MEFIDAFEAELPGGKGIIGPFGYNCLLYSALLISILALIISIVPWYLIWYGLFTICKYKCLNASK